MFSCWQLFDLFLTHVRFRFRTKFTAGETLGLVLLSSDKTHLTNTQGDKECHTVYLSCGNIRKAIRTKASAHAWLKIAQIPIVKFEEEKFQGILMKRLFHVCMDIVTRSLKKHSRSPTFICDVNGTLRYVRTVLAGYIADIPEKTHDCGCAAESITRLPSIVGPIRRRPSPRSSQRCSYLLAAAGFGEGGQSVRSPEIRERCKNRTIEWRPYAILVGLGIC